MFALHMNGWSQIDLPHNHGQEVLFEESFAESNPLENTGGVTPELENSKIKLNDASRDLLLQCGLFTTLQVEQLLVHRERFGKLLSVYELQVVGFSVAFILNILPYIQVIDQTEFPPLNWPTIKNEIKGSWLLRFQKTLQSKKGYQTTTTQTKPHYLGTSHKVFHRFRLALTERVQLGFSGEKDPGEPIDFKQNVSGLDHESGFLQLDRFGSLERLIVGDFQLNSGQGLCAWSGFSLGNSTSIVHTKRQSHTLQAHTSADENRFFRGVAGTVRMKKIRITSFFSKKKRDAQLVDDFTVSTLPTSGLHRTETEMNRRKRLSEKIWGVQLKHEGKRSVWGGLLKRTSYSHWQKPEPNTYNQFAFEGLKHAIASVFYSHVVKNANFFGEFASTKSGFAFTNGIIVALNKQLSVAINHRFFSIAFQSPNGNPNTRGNGNAEDGIYCGFELRPNEHLAVFTTIDVFRHQWLKYRTSAPGQGKQIVMLAVHEPNPNFSWSIQIKELQQMLNVTGAENTIYKVGPNRTQQIRLHMDLPIFNALRISHRIAWSRFFPFEAPQERGWMGYIDLVYQKKLSPVRFKARYAIFDTDSYETRIYAYEHNVAHAFSIPAYYYRGNRWYFYLKLKIRRHFDAELRVANWWYENRDRIGTGWEEIQGDNKTELTIQLKCKF